MGVRRGNDVPVVSKEHRHGRRHGVRDTPVAEHRHDRESECDSQDDGHRIRARGYGHGCQRKGRGPSAAGERHLDAQREPPRAPQCRHPLQG